MLECATEGMIIDWELDDLDPSWITGAEYSIKSGSSAGSFLLAETASIGWYISISTDEDECVLCEAPFMKL